MGGAGGAIGDRARGAWGEEKRVRGDAQREILLACVVALALGWRECADAPAVKGANMPFISICVQPGSNRRGCEARRIGGQEKEFFAALNAALGIGRDDAPWQWALNSGNARLEGSLKQPSATGQQRRKSRTKG
ncbi:hypothetical protein ERJ75_001136300 [Trypanosoma vivax]|nr:hypothetical protein ERJ75_001136300 [Trypanosoma vivax]